MARTPSPSSDEAPNELMGYWIAGLLDMLVPWAARLPHRQRCQAGSAVHVRTDARALGRRQPDRTRALHHRRRFAGEPRRVPGGRRRRERVPDGCRNPGGRRRRHRRQLDPGPMSVGDMYSNPGDAPALPTRCRTALPPTNRADCRAARRPVLRGVRCAAATSTPSAMNTCRTPKTSTTGSANDTRSTADMETSRTSPTPSCTARGFRTSGSARIRATPGLAWHPYGDNGFWAVTAPRRHPRGVPQP